MKTFFLITGFTFAVLVVTAQREFDSTQFWKHLEIKKSFENKIDRSKPATATFSLPSGEKNYYSINTGLAYRLTNITNRQNSANKNKLDIFSVYNRDNQIKKEQNNLKAGLTYEIKEEFFDENGIPKNFMFGLAWTNEYLHNKQDSSHNFLSTLYFQPFGTLFNSALRLGTPYGGTNSTWRAEINLIPGLEFQDKFNAPAKEFKGSLIRAYFAPSFDLNYRIHKSSSDLKMVNLLQASLAYTFRNDFYNSAQVREGYQPLFNFALSIFPFKNDNVSFGGMYQNGSDPVNGIEKQEFWKFQVQFKKELYKAGKK